MRDSATMRILDASLNRAGEGLRVVEEYVRFVLDDPLLTREAKSLRHELEKAAEAIPAMDRHAARDTPRDVGTEISTCSEATRDDAWDVCAASLKRTEQALRALEEYGKLVDISVGRQAESLRYRLYTLEKTIDIHRSSRDRLQSVRLCVLVDGQESADRFDRIVRQLVEGRVGMIQLRDKRLDDRELIARARSLVALTRRQPPAPPEVSSGGDPSKRLPPAEPGAVRTQSCRTLAIINDRADIAAAVHADGIHLGQEDLSIKDARAVVGTRMLIGASTHNIDQARTAILDGANYLGAGPTFPSQTKAFDAFAGLEYLRQVAAEIRLPTFAIGGITTNNLPDVLATGITRIAVSSAVTAAPDPAAAAKELTKLLHAPQPLAI